MFHSLALLAAIWFSALSLCARSDSPEKEQFFIVYHNGGEISPFLDLDVDSIGFSRFDADSVEHKDWYSQVVYTPDSAYMFPLAQIDSVGFQSIPTIYKPEVIHMSRAWEPLVEGYEDNIITFTSGIASVWNPRKGDVLFYNEFTDRFPYGYSGKVKDVAVDNGRYVITMGEMGLDDIYEQVMIVSSTEWLDTYQLPDSLAQLDPDPQLAPGDKRRIRESVSMSLGGSAKIKYRDLTGTVSASLNLTITTGLVKRPHGDWYFSCKASPVMKFGASLRASNRQCSWEYNGDAQVCFTGLPLRAPIPNTPFMMEFRAGPYASFNGSIGLKFDWSKTVAFPVIEVTYEENSWHYDTFTPRNSEKSGGSFGAELDCSGNITLGIVSVIGIGTNNIFGTTPSLQARLSTKSGLRLALDAKMDLNANKPYEMFKDSYVELGLGSKTSLEGAFVRNSDEVTSKVEIVSTDLSLPWKLRLRLFPDFDPIKWEPGNIKGSITAFTMAKSAVIIPQSVGLGIFDEENRMVSRSMTDSKLNWVVSELDLEMDFDGLKPLKKYTIKPLISLFGNYIEATPTADVELDMKLETWSAQNVESKKAVIRGYCDAIESGNQTQIGFVYSPNTDDAMTIDNATWVEANRTTNGAFSVTLTELDAGTTYGYRACLILGEDVYYGDMLQFTTEEPPGDAVDLGLSVCWADRNIGALAPHEAGGLFGWADPTGQETSADVMSPGGAWDSPLYGGPNPPANISGTSLDIARIQWHMQWRLPTEAEISELVNECDWTWTTSNGVPGYQVTGPNGNSIFLPVTGYRFGNEVFDAGFGYYWSGTLNNSRRTNAYRIDFCADDWDYTSYARYAGHAVRPVIDYE